MSRPELSADSLVVLSSRCATGCLDAASAVGRSRDVDEREDEEAEAPEADLDNVRADRPASNEALALFILVEGFLLASLMSGLLLSPSNLSFEPNECRGFNGASEVALMFV